MTNEEAARNLITIFHQWVNVYAPKEENLNLGNETLQIAIYALSYASGSGIQFAESDKNTEAKKKYTAELSGAIV